MWEKEGVEGWKKWKDGKGERVETRGRSSNT